MSATRIARPAKPYKGFPLTAHPCGQWVKKIRGKLRYFGKWDDAQAALNKFLKQKDDLLAGREPDEGEGLTVRELVNHFLTAKQRRVESGELTRASWSDYEATCRKVLEVFGKDRLVRNLRPIDFEELRGSFAKTHGPVRLCKDITCARMLFRYAQNFDVLVHFGEGSKQDHRS